ncbi:MAG: hypothetical protein LBL82_07390 [Oscillospiraceae bacterium]|jgi:hypothetical protein|nr:hypothetical protein [Oscillospiraceae bacterium]
MKLTHSERIFKNFKKHNPAVDKIEVESNGFYAIYDADGNVLARGDILKGWSDGRIRGVKADY